ncbi:MAG: porin [Deltaproteobacteria bacterium]|nr:porin [Deltaproteobacteria bacterium]
MQRKIGWLWAVGMMVCSLVTVCSTHAQEATPPPEAEAKPSPWSPVEAVGLAVPLKSWGLEIHGLLASNYTWNFNEPKSGKNGLLLMNRKAGHGDLDLANIRLQRVVDGELGFVVDLDFGKTAEVVGRSTWWCGGISPSVSGKGSCSESRNSFEAVQAYLTYKLPIGNGLNVKAGKFVTLHGAEVIKTWDNINYNISNSILFGWAIPFTHTGLLLNYPFADWVSADLGFIVGWDTVADNNDGKSFTGGLTVTPTSTLTLYAAGTVGPEQQDRGDSTRYLYSLLTTYKPTDKWTFILDYNVANETNLLGPFKPSGRGTKTAYWDGLAGYATYHFTDEISATLRTEFFNDADGVRTGASQTVWEITPTLAYQFLPGVTFRAEYRHDETSRKGSSANLFEGRTRLFPGQDTVAWEVLYSF